jgi:hypothetical protein
MEIEDYRTKIPISPDPETLQLPVARARFPVNFSSLIEAERLQSPAKKQKVREQAQVELQNDLKKQCKGADAEKNAAKVDKEHATAEAEKLEWRKARKTLNKRNIHFVMERLEAIHRERNATKIEENLVKLRRKKHDNWREVWDEGWEQFKLKCKENGKIEGFKEVLDDLWCETKRNTSDPEDTRCMFEVWRWNVE